MKLPTNYNRLHWQEKRAVREEYIKQQKGKCFHCEEDLSRPAPQRVTEKEIDWSFFPDNFLKYPVHLQHDHDSGLTEGAVHNYCNAVMWQYQGE